jgi:AraC family transcriptional regulator
MLLVVLRVEMRTTPPGVLKLEPLAEHRVKIHAGAPVRGACRLHRFVYTRGDVDILPAGLSDIWQEDDAGASLVVQLPPALLQRAAQRLGLHADRLDLEPRYQLRDAQIEHIVWALEAERRAGDPGGPLYSDSLGMALAVRLLSYASTKGGDTPLARVLSYIEQHLDQDLSIARLAHLAGVSATNLKSLFRRLTGLPVHQYVVQRRVERARALLARGRLPASQVALEARVAHQSHMARWMRRLA